MNFKIGTRVVIALLVLFFVGGKVYSQESTGNVFSPYSLYGIGAFDGDGTTSTQSMAGVGVATRDPFNANTVNPASFSVAMSQTMLFSFGGKGTNQYLKSSTGKTSHNNFNMNDVAAVFPIAKKIGFGFSYQPYTSVGYSISLLDKSSDVASQIGSVKYNYAGNGGIALIKAGLGWEVAKGLSIGANFNYYFGDINRLYQTIIVPFIPNTGTYKSVQGSVTNVYNVIGGEFGAQYDLKIRYDKHVTFGAVYKPRIKSEIDKTKYEYSVASGYPDSVRLVESKEDFVMPTKFAFGVAYRTDKLTLALDYSYQNWGGAFAVNEDDIFRLAKSQDLRLGFEYIPNRFDIRSTLKRWTYRAGIKVSNSYMAMNGKNLKDIAGTIGVGIPLQKNGFSAINVGAEVGTMGTVQNSLYKDIYFKVYIGVSLFTKNEWFVRHRFK